MAGGMLKVALLCVKLSLPLLAIVQLVGLIIDWADNSIGIAGYTTYTNVMYFVFILMTLNCLSGFDITMMVMYGAVGAFTILAGIREIDAYSSDLFGPIKDWKWGIHITSLILVVILFVFAIIVMIKLRKLVGDMKTGFAAALSAAST